jgi:hypothetical protein
VTVQTNLPASLAPNTNILFEVKITKGSISNFSKYQVDVPAGVTVTEGDSKTGNFTFEDNRAKIVWVSIPAEAEFVVTFKVNTGGASGAGVFNQKFYFLDNGSKKEVEFEPVNVTFDPSGATSVASLGGTAGNPSTSSEPKGSVTSTESTGSNTTTTPASSTTSETPVATTTETKTNTSTPSSTETKTTSTTSTSGSASTEPAVTKTTPTETKTTESTSSSSASTAKTTNTSATGLVFKVQLSASANDPGKAKFANAGKVTISFEDGLYKVLVGSFSTKEEAIEKMNQLKGSGFNGFVVRYQNGTRVK